MKELRDLKDLTIPQTRNPQPGGVKIGDFGLCLPATEWDEEEGDREVRPSTLKD